MDTCQMSVARVCLGLCAALGVCAATIGQTTRPATTQSLDLSYDAAVAWDGHAAYTGQDLQRQHARMSSTAVVVSFFGNGDLRSAQHCYMLADGRPGEIRYVYNHAVQGGGPSPTTSPVGEMPEKQRRTLDAILQSLPQGPAVIRDADLFLVSWSANGKRMSQRYDRTNLPPEVLGLCRFLNVPPTWL